MHCVAHDMLPNCQALTCSCLVRRVRVDVASAITYTPPVLAAIRASCAPVRDFKQRVMQLGDKI